MGRSGYNILKEKCAKLEQENLELRKKVESQSQYISKLTVDYLNAANSLESTVQKADSYWDFMGIVRRWLWYRFYKKR